MADIKPTAGYHTLMSVPVSTLKWRTTEDYILNTPLGVDECRVEILDVDGYEVLRPGEDERIRKIQARFFCEWVIETRSLILGPQLRYLLDVFNLAQGVLADAVQISASAVSQLLSGRNAPSLQTARELALLFCLESSRPGTIARLAENRIPSSARDEWRCPVQIGPTSHAASTESPNQPFLYERCRSPLKLASRREKDWRPGRSYNVTSPSHVDFGKSMTLCGNTLAADAA